MERPKLIINEREIEIPPIKARLWRTIMQFDAEEKDIFKPDTIEKYCEIIALAFGVTTEEVLDNLELPDVLPKYFDVYRAVVKMLSEKTPKKNKEAEIAVQV